MKRSIEDTPIVFIGAGNLATNLAKALYRKGFRIVQIYSRTEESARNLAEKVEAEFTTDLGDINPYARLYIVSLKDSAFTELLPDIVAGKRKGIFAGTYCRESSDECLGRVCGTLWRILSYADVQ